MKPTCRVQFWGYPIFDPQPNHRDGAPVGRSQKPLTTHLKGRRQGGCWSPSGQRESGNEPEWDSLQGNRLEGLSGSVHFSFPENQPVLRFAILHSHQHGSARRPTNQEEKVVLLQLVCAPLPCSPGGYPSKRAELGRRRLGARETGRSPRRRSAPWARLEGFSGVGLLDRGGAGGVSGGGECGAGGGGVGGGGGGGVGNGKKQELGSHMGDSVLAASFSFCLVSRCSKSRSLF